MYDIITEVLVVKIFSEKLFLQINSKWSEIRKKHNRRPIRCRQPISPVEYVNTSYHTTFHQNISINVACRGVYSSKHFEIFPIPYFQHFEKLPQNFGCFYQDSLSLYKSFSLSVSLFVCLFPNSSETANP